MIRLSKSIPFWIIFLIIILPNVALNIFGLSVNWNHFAHRFPSWCIAGFFGVLLSYFLVRKKWNVFIFLGILFLATLGILNHFLLPMQIIQKFSNNDRFEKCPKDQYLLTLSGDTLFVDSLRGQVVLFDFWFWNCGPCHSKKKAIISLSNEIAKTDSLNIKIFSVFSDPSMMFVEFSKAINEYYPGNGQLFVYDPDQQLKKSLSIERMPEEIILDKNGIIRSSFEGYTKETYSAYLRSRTKILIDLEKNPYCQLCYPPKIDIDLKSGDSLFVNIPITNCGEIPLQIDGISSTCNCIIVSESSYFLQPGEFKSLPIWVFKQKNSSQSKFIEKICIRSSCEDEFHFIIIEN